MATMNVSLPDQMKDWVETRLENASFSNTSDYVRHLIRRDQEREQAIAELQSAVNKGLESGPAQNFDLGEFLSRMHTKHGV
ncbi:antitoxin ParD1/3/4 [Thalassovita litoralis]|jgi:antitoxin ParD1/3/4|uniref:Antitoxin ParD1/3/4 n=1 Tax=Thalassovita litoralis TaxID=1010611 RepID=A0A521CLP9_9RHOB|nr:type II toxin-antitoxin system ParD family antitoxin [Thalassovita litoralis]SMO60379.1 antitoxin ParD1/3/4 [Thalassovita litoralis]